MALNMTVDADDQEILWHARGSGPGRRSTSQYWRADRANRRFVRASSSGIDCSAHDAPTDE